MTFKQKIYAHCLQLLDDKIRELEKIVEELSESATTNTKSSAGDKHETARAMIQIEQETIRKQLKEAQDQKTSLEKIVSSLSGTTERMAKVGSVARRQGLPAGQAGVRPGSLVKTNKGYLFLSIALGKISVDEKPVTVLSPQSPLGIKLMGLKVNDTAEINKVKYFIESIY